MTQDEEIAQDKETRDAIAALVYRLRNRPPEDDDEVFAIEFMTALRGRGWRATAARPLPPWQTSGDPASEETRNAVVATLRETPWYRRASSKGGTHHDDDD